MIQVTADISKLSQDEREYLAGFILTFPGAKPLPLKSAAPAPLETHPIEQDDNAVAAAAFSNLVQMPPLNGNFDKTGLPWDERIHSAAKTQTEAGVWRRKKGVSDEAFITVETELRKLMAIPSPTLPPTSLVLPNTAVVAETINVSELSAAPATVSVVPPPPVAAPVPPPPPPVAAPAPPPPPPIESNVDTRAPFIDLLNVASGAITGGKVTMDEVIAITKRHGIESLPLLNVRLDLVPAIRSELDLLIATKG